MARGIAIRLIGYIVCMRRKRLSSPKKTNQNSIARRKAKMESLLYKVVRHNNGISEHLYHQKKDGQYYFMPLTGKKFSAFSLEDAIDWKAHLEAVKRYADGSTRQVGGNGQFHVTLITEKVKNFNAEIWNDNGTLTFACTGVLATREEYEQADRCVGSIFEALEPGEIITLSEGDFVLDEDLDCQIRL